MSDPIDLVILGGGCAGLSLASALADGHHPLRVLVVEPREAYLNDRTWAYWAVEGHPFRALETHRWTRWQVRLRGRVLERSCEEYPYTRIPALDFYHDAMRRMLAAPAVALDLGCAAHQVERVGRRGFVVHTDHGPLPARAVADTRPPERPFSRRHPGLWQHFLGQQVVAGHAVFDPERVMLMDFDCDQSAGIHFMYLLPLDPRRALVVDTYLSATPLPELRYRTNLRDYLYREFGLGIYGVEHEEQGAIPMTTRPLRCGGPRGWLRLGAAGGAIKPSTGFGFLGVQRQVAALAAAMAHAPGAIPHCPPDIHPALPAWMDRVFLAHLMDRPEEAPALFFRLFEAMEPAALVRFLSDRPRGSDLRKVFRALPALPLARTALRRLPQCVPF